MLPVAGVPMLDRVLAAVAGAGRRIVVGPPRDGLPPDVLTTREHPPGAGPAAATAAALRLIPPPQPTAIVQPTAAGQPTAAVPPTAPAVASVPPAAAVPPTAAVPPAAAGAPAATSPAVSVPAVATVLGAAVAVTGSVSAVVASSSGSVTGLGSVTGSGSGSVTGLAAPGSGVDGRRVVAPGPGSAPAVPLSVLSDAAVAGDRGAVVGGGLVGLFAADLPHLAAGAVQVLVDAVVEGMDGAVFVDERGRRQLLCGVWRVGALRQNVERLGDPVGKSMRSVFDGLVVAEVRWEREGASPYFDCDTDEDLREAETRPD